MELLNKIQQQLKAPKSQYNSFGKYNYRNCEDILEAVKPLLGTGTLVITDEIVMFGTPSFVKTINEKGKEKLVDTGGRFYVKAIATLSDGKETVFASAYARECLDKSGMDEAQITGAASSYARKYALNGLFLIDDTRDADTQNNTVKTAPVTSQKPTVSLKQRVADALAHVALGDMKTLDSGDSYKEYCKTRTGLELTEANYQAILKALNK